MTITKHNLAYFTGTVNYFTHRQFKGYAHTDGVHYLMEHGANWLVTAIYSWQFEANVQVENWQQWKLKVNLEQKTAVLIADDGNGRELAKQEIEYTDFPIEEVTLFLINRVLLLSSEY